jgi:hypothetical protein
VENGRKPEDFISEDSLLDWLKLRKVTLNGLRADRQFPFIKVSSVVRMYYVPDVLAWLLANRKVLNRGLGLPKNNRSEADETTG